MKTRKNLAVTYIKIILVILIIAVGIYYGIKALSKGCNNEEYETIKTNMLLIQGKTEVIAQRVEIEEEGAEYIGTEIKEKQDDAKIQNLINNNDKAPGLTIGLKAEREVQGNVFLDNTNEATLQGQERQGNGIYDTGENLVNVEKGLITVDDVDEDLISKNLYTAGLDDPNLIIRTSGEERLSGFLLWQSSYSELYFCESLWIFS